MHNLQKILQQTYYFNELPTEQINKIIPHCKEKKLNAGGTLFAMDSNGNKLYILLAGELVLYFKDEREIILHEGDCFGEISLITEHGRLGTIKATKACELIAVDKKVLLTDLVLDYASALQISLKMANRSIKYLLENYSFNVKTLIEKGEGLQIEFKQSYSRDKKARDTIFRTMNAFLNTAGGTIIVGVKDDRTVVGIKNCNYRERDRLSNEVITRAKNFGDDIINFVNVNFEDIDGKMVMRIDVKYIDRAVFMPDQEQRYYVRKKCTTQQLDKMATFRDLKRRNIL